MFTTLQRGEVKLPKHILHQSIQVIGDGIAINRLGFLISRTVFIYVFIMKCIITLRAPKTHP